MGMGGMGGMGGGEVVNNYYGGDGGPGGGTMDCAPRQEPHAFLSFELVELAFYEEVAELSFCGKQAKQVTCNAE